ncbi:MAG: hypothetical protein LBP26_04290 [Clostridiales bacterium]|jgi:tetratricopeptide (TPR) repeat protein|nr:hypothetical protein [Clostridiales bacterium]
MSLENGRCENCGGTLILDNAKEKAVCKYCGGEIVILQAIQKCAVDGVVTFDARLLAAQRAAELDGDFDKARKEYKEALSLKPDDYRALWGLFACEIDSIRWDKRHKGFVQFPGDINNNIRTAVDRYGERALRNAPDEIKPYYDRKIEEAKALSEGDRQPQKKGCYIATAVYGSYNRPQVCVLRRYRDERLSATRRGRLLIKIYYALSPALVKMFGAKKTFNAFCKKRLDKLVTKLLAQGIADTEYNDK